MNTDIRLSTDFFGNVKVKKLKKRLGADGVLALIALWAYCAKMYPDGELGKQADGDVELMADWEGEDGALESALIELGFLDVHDDGTLALHDWAENNPYVADSRARGDTQRLNRLGGQNPTAAKAARDAGLNGITKEQYYAIRHVNSYEAAMSYLQNGEAVTPPSDKTETVVPPVNDGLPTVDEEPLTTVERPSTTGTTPAPAPAPDPAPVPVPVPEPARGYKNTNTRPRPEPVTAAGAASASPPDCPHEAIIGLYREILPMLPRVQLWTDARRSLLRTRWREDDARQNLDWWRHYFELVADSDFLCGRCPPGKTGRPFMADLEWLIRPTNMPKVLEGKYANRDATDALEEAKRLGYDETRRRAFGDFSSLRDEYIDIDGEVRGT